MKYFEVTIELSLLVVLCVTPHCLPGAVYKYLTPEDRSRLIEVEFGPNGKYKDCVVFGDGGVIQDILKDVPAQQVVEMGKEDIDHSTRTCHDLHLTLENSPLRKKRALKIIYPGTKWCGLNNIADHYDDLGRHNFTDACCRDHDNCDAVLGPFERKYGLFNWRPYSVYNCTCDDNFYRCLKTVNNDVAINIGKIYFNLLGSVCVKEVHPRKCVKYWWFICTEYGEDKTKLEKQLVNNPSF